MPSREIVVFHEKHGDTFYDIEASGGFDRVCYAVFLERDKVGWLYPKDPPVKPEKPQTGEPTNAQEAMGMAAAWESYGYSVKEFKFEREQWHFLEKARQGDFDAARSLIELRDRHGYENYTRETLHVIGSEEVPTYLNPKSDQVGMNLIMLALTQESEHPSPTPEGREARTKYLTTCRDSFLAAQVYRPVHPATPEEDHAVHILRGALDRLIRKPGDLAEQDSALRVLDKVKYDYDRGEIERVRLQRFGDVESIARARFQDRFGRPYEGPTDKEHGYFENTILRDSKQRLGIAT